jgi:hypothetical protein
MNRLSVSAQWVHAFVSKRLCCFYIALQQKRLHEAIRNEHCGIESAAVSFNTAR